MSLSAAVLDALIATGATREQLAAVMRADIAEREAREARQVPWERLRVMAFERDGEKCGWCGCEDGPFEIDHITPRSKGGENVLENVIVSCRPCNRAKKDREEAEWSDLHARRVNDRERKRRQRSRDKSRDNRDTIGKSAVTRDTPPNGSPKDINQTPSLPPAEVSEPIGSSPQSRPWSLPVGVSLQVWTDFLSNRKRKKAGNTPTAWTKFRNDLRRVSSQTGIPPPKLIEHAAASGWAGIYDPNEDKGHGRTNGLGRHQPDDGLSPTTRAAMSVFGPIEASHERSVPQ